MERWARVRPTPTPRSPRPTPHNVAGSTRTLLTANPGGRRTPAKIKPVTLEAERTRTDTLEQEFDNADWSSANTDMDD